LTALGGSIPFGGGGLIDGVWPVQYSAGGQNSPVQSPSPPPVPPGCRFPGCVQPVGDPAFMSPASQLRGAALDAGQPVEYTADAVWAERGTGEVK
jgi:hypothetical protein